VPQFFLSCPKGLEEMLENEARLVLGEHVKGLKQEDGGIKLNTDTEQFLYLMLSTRIGSRGHMQLGQWPLYDMQELKQLAMEFPVEEHMSVEQTFKINTLFDPLARQEFKNSMLTSQVFKDGIADRFRAKKGVRPSVDLKNPDITFLLRIEGARNAKKVAPYMLTLYCDLSGPPLSNRSYRVSEHVAPLRENVAASLVYKATFEADDTFLFDPFVGTGTILAEAAMYKANAVPSFLNLPVWRKYYAFARQLWFKADKGLNEKVDSWARDQYEKSRTGLLQLPGNFFYGSDIDRSAIGMAQQTMAALGIEKKVHMNVADALKAMPPKSTKGLIICNPPYGERLSTPEEADKLFYDLGEHFKTNFKGHRAFFLSGDPKAYKNIHLKTSCKMPVYNGDIDCRLLGYKLF
jgi:putative N6-adenine-specific DNA methylase